jgi:hypothetical protein
VPQDRGPYVTSLDNDDPWVAVLDIATYLFCKFIVPLVPSHTYHGALRDDSEPKYIIIISDSGTRVDNICQAFSKVVVPNIL